MSKSSGALRSYVAQSKSVHKKITPSPARNLSGVVLGRPHRIKQATKATENGRNAPCPCGSGKKYKQCCLKK